MPSSAQRENLASSCALRPQSGITETSRVVLRVGQRLACANRSEQGKALFIKSVEVEAEKLFRIRWPSYI